MPKRKATEESSSNPDPSIPNSSESSPLLALLRNFLGSDGSNQPAPSLNTRGTPTAPTAPVRAAGSQAQKEAEVLSSSIREQAPQNQLPVTAPLDSNYLSLLLGNPGLTQAMLNQQQNSNLGVLMAPLPIPTSQAINPGTYSPGSLGTIQTSQNLKTKPIMPATQPGTSSSSSSGFCGLNLSLGASPNRISASLPPGALTAPIRTSSSGDTAGLNPQTMTAIHNFGEVSCSNPKPMAQNRDSRPLDLHAPRVAPPKVLAPSTTPSLMFPKFVLGAQQASSPTPRLLAMLTETPSRSSPVPVTTKVRGMKSTEPKGSPVRQTATAHGKPQVQHHQPQQAALTHPVHQLSPLLQSLLAENVAQQETIARLQRELKSAKSLLRARQIKPQKIQQDVENGADLIQMLQSITSLEAKINTALNIICALSPETVTGIVDMMAADLMRQQEAVKKEEDMDPNQPSTSDGRR